MRLTIGVEGAGATLALSSLYRWLRDEPTLRGRLERQPDARQGEMLGGAEQLVVVLSTALDASHLITSIVAWRRAQNIDGLTITLDYGDSQVRIADVPAEDLARVMAVALRSEAEPDDSLTVRPDNHHSTPPGPPFGDDDDEW